MRRLVIDCETLGLGLSPVILSIGAVDPDGRRWVPPMVRRCAADDAMADAGYLVRMLQGHRRA